MKCGEHVRARDEFSTRMHNDRGAHTPIATLREHRPERTHISHFFLISLNVNIHSYRYIKFTIVLFLSPRAAVFVEGLQSW